MKQADLVAAPGERKSGLSLEALNGLKSLGINGFLKFDETAYRELGEPKFSEMN